VNNKVLIIDDEPDLRGLLGQRLAQEGYEVFTAADGKEGLACFDEFESDLVITDLLMPELDGLEVIRILKARPRPPLMIAMSGGASRDLDFLLEAVEFGADRTLAKPFGLEALVALVKELFRESFHPRSHQN
jgi:DNA-binding response OmpR family regulator